VAAILRQRIAINRRHKRGIELLGNVLLLAMQFEVRKLPSPAAEAGAHLSVGVREQGLTVHFLELLYLTDTTWS
jgi:hypothetical protein